MWQGRVWQGNGYVPFLVARRRRDGGPGRGSALRGAEAAHEVVEEAKDAGVWVFGGGLESRRATSRPPTGRSPTARGFAIVDVSSHEEALEWAAKIALACRCAQEVRELLPDPTV